MSKGVHEQHGGNVAMDGTEETGKKGQTQKEIKKEQQQSKYNEEERCGMIDLKLDKGEVKCKFTYEQIHLCKCSLKVLVQYMELFQK